MGNETHSINNLVAFAPIKLPRDPGGRVLQHKICGPKRDETIRDWEKTT
jgi:hypothetical protein